MTAKLLLLVGDVHGHYNRFNRIVRDNPNKQVLQIGDLGIGFANKEKLLFPPDAPSWWAFHGNHDCRDLFEQLPCWLGPYGILPEREDVFFVGGARSVDQQYRTEGVDWWRNEELSLVEAYDCLKDYQAVQPRIVISHDAPQSWIPSLIKGDPKGHAAAWGEQPASRTGLLLQAMLEAHRPEMWVHAHWHYRLDRIVDGIRHACLEELGTLELP